MAGVSFQRLLSLNHTISEVETESMDLSSPLVVSTISVQENAFSIRPKMVEVKFSVVKINKTKVVINGILPDLGTGCTSKQGKPPCDFKHFNTLDEYIDY